MDEKRSKNKQSFFHKTCVYLRTFSDTNKKHWYKQA